MTVVAPLLGATDRGAIDTQWYYYVRLLTVVTLLRSAIDRGAIDT